VIATGKSLCYICRKRVEIEFLKGGLSMSKRIFIPGDILLPAVEDLTRWSVIACDQYTSQPAYWEQVEKTVGDAKSSLRLMLPEAYLESRDCAAETLKINRTMETYLADGIFQTIENSYIYLERTLADGRLRRGLVGLIDLDAYDYGKDTISPVRPTEGTVESRLPPRVAVRMDAALEMPHVVVFIDDPEQKVIEPLSDLVHSEAPLYDFDLMQKSGHVRGWRVSGDLAGQVQSALDHLADHEVLKEKYGYNPNAPVLYAMGDGNHSLATAKLCWEKIKAGLTPEACANHPARYSMVEISNIHEPSIVFEPIHRVVFNTDSDPFLREFSTYLAEQSREPDGGYVVQVVAGGDSKELSVTGLSMGGLVSAVDAFLHEYMLRHGGAVDYIHGDDTALEMGRQRGSVAILLPALDKKDLFPSIMQHGAFPKKSFSIGHAEDKRFYLECRKIK
jgi:hypothetical protein